MKLKSIITTLGAVAVVACIAVSCDKQVGKEVATENTDFSDKAFVQLYNAISGSPTTIQVSVDANSVTGAGVGLGGTFPSTPANISVQNGFRAFLIRDAATTTTFPYISFAENLQAGSYYTIFAYDTVISPKQKIVKNNIVIPSDTTARLRFANFVYNPTALPTGFDIYSVKRQAVIFSNVHETEVTEYIPIASASTDTFYLRMNGTNVNMQNLDTTGKTVMVDIRSIFTPTRLRSYTLIFRGSYRIPFNKTTAGAAIAAARQLSVFANY
jgi:hypothetical protein